MTLILLIATGLIIASVAYLFFKKNPVVEDPVIPDDPPPNSSLEEIDVCAGLKGAPMRSFSSEVKRHGKGRLKSPVTAKQKYPMRAMLSSTTSLLATISSRLWLTGKVLDQGDTPQCVAYSGVQFLRTAPIRQEPPFTPAELYNECKKIDNYPNQDGTSVDALFKVLKAQGLVESYHWAETVSDAVTWLLDTGPVVMGFLVDEGTFEDAENDFFVKISDHGDGHAVLLSGADKHKICPDGSTGAARITNSWGVSWYCGGKAWISFTDLQKVLDTGGELVAAIEPQF